MRALRRAAQSQYRALVEANARQNGREQPESVERYWMSLTGYEYAQAVRDFVGGARRVLVIGDGGGRDFWSLRALGKEVTAVDVAPQSVIPDVVIANVTEPLPFPDGSFDAVVMAEVIEHLFADVEALDNVRRVLADDGALVLTVPFYNDAPEFHARVHTELSLRRLLAHAGWEITDFETKGGGFAWLDTLLPVRVVKHGLNYLAWRLTGRSRYERWNSRLAALDRRWGRRGSRVHRASPYFGAFLRARKGDRVDYTAINVEEFTDYQTG
jgi:SAM-dependent methyltransferase